MNTRLLTALVVAGALFVPLASNGAEGTADRTHPVAFVKDSVITTKIKAKLAAEKMSTLARISVDTDSNGMVVLSGSARTQEVVNKAGEIARDVEGVTSVQNNIKIKKDD